MMKGSSVHCSGKLFIAVLVGLMCFVALPGFAGEDKEEGQRPKNAKLIKEYDDGKGHTIREIQYTQGSMLVTEQIIMPKKRLSMIGIRRPFSLDTMNRDSLYVVVSKSLYCVQLYYKKDILRAYKAVFGPNPKANKCMEGDRCTPEGWFKISSKNPNSKYNKFMLINYPNDSSVARFNTLKRKGQIPTAAKIGGAVGIHGIWKGGDDMIEMGVGWTDGCVALKNRDVEELYSIIGVGTRVYIRR
jgi:murein L,D-transpeptidase YafK